MPVNSRWGVPKARLQFPFSAQRVMSALAPYQSNDAVACDRAGRSGAQSILSNVPLDETPIVGISRPTPKPTYHLACEGFVGFRRKHEVQA
jgi:hypothetical protein